MTVATLYLTMSLCLQDGKKPNPAGSDRKSKSQSTAKSAEKKGAAKADVEELSTKAGIVLERYCLRCHRGKGSKSGFAFDVRDAASMSKEGVVVPSNADDSQLWVLMQRGAMPPKSLPQLPTPTPDEAAAVAAWIKAGAGPLPRPQSRPHIALPTILQNIHDDLKKLTDARSRRRQRYFSLVELHNNPAVSDALLDFARIGLAKTLNSLSWESELAEVRAINESRTVFAVDIEKLGWSREHWLSVRVRYPYGMGFGNLDDKSLRDLDAEIQHLLQNVEPLYVVRGDWFQATATQPALYHKLLYDLHLPELRRRQADPHRSDNPYGMTAADLEHYLGVDASKNIERGEDRAGRAGFTSSGVSGQNRLVERHKTKFGAYWKSYDFKANNRRSILSQFPLGPANDSLRKFKELAFEQDGGEMIFNLPNGLQAYLLVDGKENRIDGGPIEVVSDALNTSGTPVIVNGLSCMACHKLGTIDPPEDEIRKSARVFGEAREQVERLYPDKETMDGWIKKDRKRFLDAFVLAVAKARLGEADDADEPSSNGPEPISEVARRHLLEELDLRTVAAELHEKNVDRLRAKIEHDETLQAIGLAVLLKPDGKIKRAYWEGTQDGVSVMQLTAFALDYTTPNFKE